MNPFKHFLDIFKRSNPEHDDAIRRFVRLLLFQAQQDGAIELIVGRASPKGVPMKYKSKNAWHELPPFPSHIRPDVVSELLRMAHFPAGHFPGEGVLEERFGDVQLRWIVAMTDAEGECRLKRIED